MKLVKINTKLFSGYFWLLFNHCWYFQCFSNGLQCLEFGGCMMQNINAPSGQQKSLQDIYKDSTNQYTMLCVRIHYFDIKIFKF